MLKIDRYATCLQRAQDDFCANNRKRHLRILSIARKFLSSTVLNELHLSWFMDARYPHISVPFTDNYDLRFSVTEYIRTVDGVSYTSDGLEIFLVDIYRTDRGFCTFRLTEEIDAGKQTNTKDFRKWVFTQTCYSIIKISELMGGDTTYT